jgi:glycosyltransferase involved in cell wall biosynthesis
VLVVGPGDRSAGGVRAVMAMLAGSSLGQRFELVEVETHADAVLPAKIAIAGRGLARVAELLARGRIDIVYLHSASYGSFRRKAIAAAMARAAGRPYVLHVHGGAFADYHRRAARPERALIRRTLSRACAVVALTPVWARRLEEISPCRTVVVPNPVRLPERRAEPSRRPARVVTLGRLGEAKGSLVLVRAFAALADHPEATLILAGDGPPEPVRALAKRLGVSDHVITPGWIGPEARDELLAGASVFVLPSRQEGLPLAMLEAMAFGLPVVVSPVGGVPEVVRDGREGWLVPPDDPAAVTRALGHLLADPVAATRMGQCARHTMEAGYSLDVVADRLGDLIASCLRPVV